MYAHGIYSARTALLAYEGIMARLKLERERETQYILILRHLIRWVRVTKIMKHNCANKGQDKLHGKGNRVFNVFKNKSQQVSARCTVCGLDQSVKV